MGLLSLKQRIMDTILTTEGKRQLALGKLDIQYYSFTDSNAFYDYSTLDSGSLDAGRRISFEATSLPQDRIMFESSANGNVLLFKGTNFFVSNGRLLQAVTNSVGLQRTYDAVTGSNFTNQVGSLLSASIQNFNNLYIIGSPNIFENGKTGFTLGKNNLTFTLSDRKPIPTEETQEISIDHKESIFFDKHFSHVPNFLYLPPVNKFSADTRTCNSLGSYAKLNQRQIFDYKDLLNEIRPSQQDGYEEVVSFLDTTQTNNILGQMFEVGNGELKKLDIIDFGSFKSDKTQLSSIELQKAVEEGVDLELESSTKHVFFVGKSFLDKTNSLTFIKLFTVILE